MEQIHAYAIRRIKEEIPREILDKTFIRRDLQMNLFQHTTLDASIRAAVLDASVYLDIKLLTGRETNISLEGVEPITNIDGSTTLHIPLALTGGREILEVYRVGFQDTTTKFASTFNSSSEVDRRVDAIINNSGAIPVTSTTECEMIAPNVILVNLYSIVPTFLNAEVNLNVSSEMTHIPPKAFDKFGSLCVEKCKQYIYNHHRINLGRGLVERGMEIGVFAEEISTYSDAALNYRDLLKGWRRTEFHLDIEKKTKFIRLITPSLM